MELQHRSYSTDLIRPKPKTAFEKTSQTWMIVTAWNDPQVADQVIGLIQDQLSTLQEADATVLRNSSNGLTEESNKLLAAAQMAQQRIYNQFNSKEFSVAVELALVTRNRNRLSWVQVGAPSLLLVTEKGLQPLCHAPDWSSQLSQDAPLVGSAMGLHRDTQFNCGSCQIQSHEKLLLIAKSYIPPSLYQMIKIQLETVAQALAEENSRQPFWLGMIEF